MRHFGGLAAFRFKGAGAGVSHLQLCPKPRYKVLAGERAGAFLFSLGPVCRPSPSAAHLFHLLWRDCGQHARRSSAAWAGTGPRPAASAHCEFVVSGYIMTLSLSLKTTIWRRVGGARTFVLRAEGFDLLRVDAQLPPRLAPNPPPSAEQPSAKGIARPAYS